MRPLLWPLRSQRLERWLAILQTITLSPHTLALDSHSTRTSDLTCDTWTIDPAFSPSSELPLPFTVHPVLLYPLWTAPVPSKPTAAPPSPPSSHPSPSPTQPHSYDRTVPHSQHNKQINRQHKLKQIEQQSQQPFKMERFKHVGSVVGAEVERRREEVRGKEKKFLKKNEGKSVVKRGANAVVGERLEEYQRTERRAGMEEAEEDAYKEYADEVGAGGSTSNEHHAATRHTGMALRLQREQEEKTAITTSSYSPSPSSSPLYSARSSASTSSRSTPKNFIAANALSVIHTLPPPPPPPAATANELLHSSFGRTPAYLLARKEEAEERKKQAVVDRKARAVPAGMRRVEEDERQATLARLREEGAVVERAIMALPLRCETVSRKRQKDELERKMKDIEEAITLFSKSTVYITL